MEHRFFSLELDFYAPGRWYLDEPTNLAGHEVDDIWEFIQGKPVDLRERLRIPIYKAGTPLDFDTTTVGGAPIVNERVASVFRELAPQDTQLFPVEVEGQTAPYFLLNVTRELRCIDDTACEEVQLWTPEDGRPDRVGEYHSVSGLRIDPSKVGDTRVFRLWGWHAPVIVTGKIKDALERLGIVGAYFQPVTGPHMAPSDGPSRPSPHANPELLQRMSAAREAAWRSLGELSEEAFVPLVPEGDPWPAARQVWRLIRRPQGRTLWVSDGLSDPFCERTEPSAGHGLELAIETDEPLADSGDWPLQLLRRVCQELARHAHLREALLTRTLCLEVPGDAMPEPLVTQQGRVGVLLGMSTRTLPASLPTPAGQVRLVTLKALLPRELAFLLEHGKTALLQRLAQRGEEHLSRAWRPSSV